VLRHRGEWQEDETIKKIKREIDRENDNWG